VGRGESKEEAQEKLERLLAGFHQVMDDLLEDPYLLYRVATHLNRSNVVSPWYPLISGVEMDRLFWDRLTMEGRIVARVEPKDGAWKWETYSQRDIDWGTPRAILGNGYCSSLEEAQSECDAFLSSEAGGSWFGTGPNYKIY